MFIWDVVAEQDAAGLEIGDGRAVRLNQIVEKGEAFQHVCELGARPAAGNGKTDALLRGSPQRARVSLGYGDVVVAQQGSVQIGCDQPDIGNFSHVRAPPAGAADSRTRTSQ